MGSATIASIKNFQRQREYVTQYAMGIPITSRMHVTHVASLSVSVMACQFMRCAKKGLSRLSQQSESSQVDFWERTSLLFLVVFLFPGALSDWRFGDVEPVVLQQCLAFRCLQEFNELLRQIFLRGRLHDNHSLIDRRIEVLRDRKVTAFAL